MTDAERRLWHHLRAHRFAGVSFRRQTPIGHYIVDFVSHSARLVIEVDGGQHNDNRADVQRDAWLASKGYRVLRFWNNDVLQQTEAVLSIIAASLEKSHPPPGDDR